MSYIFHMKLFVPTIVLIISTGCGKVPVELDRDQCPPTNPKCKAPDAKDGSTIYTNVSSPTWSWDSSAVTGIEYATTLENVAPNKSFKGSKIASYTSPAKLADGEYTLYLWSKPRRAAEWSVYYRFKTIVDTIPPVITFKSISPISPSEVLTPTIKGTVSESSTVELFSDLECKKTLSSKPDTNIAFEETGLTSLTLSLDSVNFIYAAAQDLAGNRSSCINLATYSTSVNLEAPTFSVAAGTYTSPQSVLLSSNVVGASIHYTTDGSTPNNSSTLYSTAISVSADQTIKAIAVKTGFSNSQVATAGYVITGSVSTPTFAVAAGTYTSTQTVTISTTTGGSTIYYTTDGSTPTTASSVYGSALSVSTTQTVRALATKATWADSAVASAAYTITGTVATPTFSVAAGSYTSTQTVTISTTTGGSTIYYTTDGSTPTTASSVYSSALSVSTTQTVRALATKATWADSAVASAAYTITGTVATPTFSVAAGTYGSTQTVALSTTTSGSTIYYTTNGSTPTTASSVYASALSVSTTQTVRALATKATWADSAVASAAYTISVPVTLTYSGTTFLETSDNVGAIRTTKLVTITGDTWASGVYSSGGRYSVTNIPAGLTFIVTYYNSSTLILSFSGSASAHANGNDVSNIVLTLNASAFTSGVAATSNNPKTLSIDYSTSFSSPQTIFVSSTAYSGDLGGLAGADAKCQATAESASLTGAWKALLSSGTVSASSRIVVPGVLNDRAGTYVANGSADLWDGNIDIEINLNESNASLVSGDDKRWSGSDTSGSFVAETCSSWTSPVGQGYFGRGGEANDSWIYHNPSNCASLLHLHCINGQ